MRFATVALFFSGCFAQTAVDLAHQSKSVDFSGMAHTRPAQVGTSLPAACAVGEVFFKSDAAPGKNLYVATSASPCTWTQVAAPAATAGGSPGQIQYNNTGSFNGFTVSGDGTLNTATGALTVTKTNGAFFAPSATIDATSASNITAGTLPGGRLPVFAGDVSSAGGSAAINVLRINGTSVPLNASADTVLGTTGAATAAWFAIPNCQDSSGNHLNYNTTIHAFTCGTTGSGGGGGTSGGMPLVDDTGAAANAYAGCPAGAPALTDGFAILFRAKYANTSNSTFAYCGGTAKKVMNSDATELGAGHMSQSPIALWNHAATKTYNGNQSFVIGDLVWDNGTAQWYVSVFTGTCVGCLADASKLIPVNPRTVTLVYHQQVDRWEIHSSLRHATTTEASSGTDNTTAMSPLEVLQSINQNAPLATATPNRYDYGRYTGSAWAGAGTPTNPGSGRVPRRWIVDGSTILRSDGMLPFLTGCSTGPVALAPTGVRPMMLQYSSGGTAPGSSCYISNGSLSPTWAGTTIKFDTQVQVSATANISYLIGVVGSAAAQSSGVLSYSAGSYAAPLAAFRFNTAAGDARWKCVASVDGTTPVVVDTGAQGTVDGNVHQFQIFIDDALNTMHFYLDTTEVCAGTAWGPELPANSAMTPYLGIYQTAAFGSPQTLTLAYVWLEANR